MKSRGYSLIEAVVAIGVFAVVMVGFLTMFDTSTKVSKVQTAISAAQENVRYLSNYVVRYARMAGSGGLPVINPTTHLPQALEINDNVAAGTTRPGPVSGVDLELVPGTDELVLWGAFSSPIFDLAAGSYTLTGSTGSCTVPAASPITGQPQDTSQVLAALTAGKPVAALLVSVQRNEMLLDAGHSRPQTLYGAVVLTSGDAGGNFNFKMDDATPPTVGSMNPGGTFPTGMADVVRLSPLNGLRMFVAYETGTRVPTLYMTNFLGGTTQEIASDVVDLQIAFGCDRDVNGVILEDRSAARADEWLFNNRRGTGTETVADLRNAGDTMPMVAYITQMRVTVVTRAPAPEAKFRQAMIKGTIEPSPDDMVFNENGRDIMADGLYLGQPVSTYHYRALTETIKLRGLGPIL